MTPSDNLQLIKYKVQQILEKRSLKGAAGLSEAEYTHFQDLIGHLKQQSSVHFVATCLVFMCNEEGRNFLSMKTLILLL